MQRPCHRSDLHQAAKSSRPACRVGCVGCQGDCPQLPVTDRPPTNSPALRCPYRFATRIWPVRAYTGVGRSCGVGGKSRVPTGGPTREHRQSAYHRPRRGVGGEAASGVGWHGPERSVGPLTKGRVSDRGSECGGTGAGDRPDHGSHVDDGSAAVHPRGGHVPRKRGGPPGSTWATTSVSITADLTKSTSR